MQDTPPPQGWSAAASLEPGDVFVAANATQQPADMRLGLKGWGRILHCDAELRVKSEIYTGAFGLVVGLLADSTRRRLYFSSPQLSEVSCFDLDTRALISPALPPKRRYGNLISTAAGEILIGVHSAHGPAAETDEHGDGKLVRFDPVSGAFAFYDIEIDGGRSGKHYVSNLALAPDGRTVFYVSEAGRRVMRYDIAARRQLDDFYNVPEAEGGTYGLSVADDGRVFMAMGTGAALFSPQGEVLRRYEVSADKGWTRARLCQDQRYFFLSNFLDGVLEKRDAATGAIVAKLDVGLKGSLTSVDEFTPEADA